MYLKNVDGIELDICAACHGVWFDRNELELLLLRQRKRSQAIERFRKDSLFKSAPEDVAGEAVDAMGFVADLIQLLSSR